MPSGVYLHIPFCKSRCSYCDFATDVYRDADSVERYVKAISKEISEFGSRSERFETDTIYLGGGTPSLLLPNQLEQILAAVRDTFAVTSDVEITLEMNPATVSTATLLEYRGLGVNRASFGVQTFDDHALRMLARGHDSKDALSTFRMLRETGFANVSLDLIAGLPRQTLEDWRQNLEKAIDLGPDHISLYLLEIHESTPLAGQVQTGRQPRPDEELAAEMYEIMLEMLPRAGFRQYEISNFSLPGSESRHNTKYWQLDPVFGFGVSAHSFDGRERYSNVRDTAKYVELIEQTGKAEIDREPSDLPSEAAFLGLRLERGIDTEEFAKRFGIDLMEKYGAKLSYLTRAGLIIAEDGNLRLTTKGKLFSNEVFELFV
jgi:oxygen-independent coproporphyrinogen-3 oxidase